MTPDIQINPDRNHLTTLAILHYVLGGLYVFIGCIPLIHVSLGIAMLSGALDKGRNPPPPELGVVFIIVGASFSLGFWTVAVLTVIAGRCLARRVAYGYCFFIAIVDCLYMPVGTALGIFTIIVLSRESVQMLFKGIEPGDSDSN